MYKFIVLSLLILSITGCATHYSDPSLSSNNSDDKIMSEKILVKSSNYPRLIELYKDRLKDKESFETRLKLVKVYIDSHDNESALFTLAPLVMQQKVDPEVFYFQGVAQYNLGRIKPAQHSILIVLQHEPENAKALNMLGIIYADQGELEKARQIFNQARGLMYDDVTIKNNLALLDMLEGKYQSAASTLLPVYLNNRGKVDESVRANLALIMAKLGSFDYIASLYADKYTKAQLLAIYHDLKASKLVVRKTPEAISKDAVSKEADTFILTQANTDNGANQSRNISSTVSQVKVNKESADNPLVEPLLRNKDSLVKSDSKALIVYPLGGNGIKAPTDTANLGNTITTPLMLQAAEANAEGSDDE